MLSGKGDHCASSVFPFLSTPTSALVCREAASCCVYSTHLQGYSWYRTYWLCFLKGLGVQTFVTNQLPSLMIGLRGHISSKNTMSCTGVSPYPQWIYSKTPSGCLKLQIVLNLIYIIFLNIHTYDKV